MLRNLFHDIRKLLPPRRAFLSAYAEAARVDPRRYDDHVLVHTMAKVGSKTIVESVKETLPGAYVQITHGLSLDSLNHAEKTFDRLPIQQWVELDKCRAISRMIRKPPFPIQWKIISPVREPIARDVSYFFECIPLLRPDLAASSDCSVDELIELFLELIDEDSRLHFVSHPMYWFDDEILPLLGVDVFSTPFDHERGFVVFETTNAKLVVPRLEDFKKSLRPSLQELLGIENVNITNSNRAGDDQRAYYKRYDEFRRELRLPQSYVDKVYSSKFCTHFYLPSEIEKFRDKWKTK